MTTLDPRIASEVKRLVHDEMQKMGLVFGEFLNYADARKYVGIRHSTFASHVDAGDIQFTVTGHCHLGPIRIFARSDLDAFKDKLKETAA